MYICTYIHVHIYLQICIYNRIHIIYIYGTEFGCLRTHINNQKTKYRWQGGESPFLLPLSMLPVCDRVGQ